MNYKMAHTFISVFYSNAVGRNVNVAFENHLCCFYTLGRKAKESPHEFPSKYLNTK
jgi:hypothetical protein